MHLTFTPVLENGEVDFDEFLKMIAARLTRQATDCEMKEAFRVFDKDGSGFISSDELKIVMESLGETLTDAEVEAMMKEADKDSDGQVSYEGKFSAWKVHERCPHEGTYM